MQIKVNISVNLGTKVNKLTFVKLTAKLKIIVLNVFLDMKKQVTL